jgi:hypothetical protein
MANPVGPGAVETQSDLVLVPLKDAFATWWRLRMVEHLPEEKVSMDVEVRVFGERTTRERKYTQIAEGDRTYVFPPRYVPTAETTVDREGNVVPVFHDRWAWACLQAAENEVESLRLGVRAAGPAGVDGLDEAAGATRKERYDRAKARLARLVGDAARAVYPHWKARADSAYARMATDRLTELQRAAVGVWRDLHAAVTWDGRKEERYAGAELDLVELGRAADRLGLGRRAWRAADERANARKVRNLSRKLWVTRINPDVAICESEV